MKSRRERYATAAPHQEVTFNNTCDDSIIQSLDFVRWRIETNVCPEIASSLDRTYYLRRIGLGVGHRGCRTALSMRYERSNNAPKPPLCSNCAQIMRLARITLRFGVLPDLYTFECRACGVSYIEAAAPFAASNSHASVGYEVRARTK